MSRGTQSILLFLSYTIIIVGVFVYSGKTREKTLYDKYTIYPESTVMRVSDLDKAKSFYSQVLDFPLLKSKGSPPAQNIVGFQLPGKRRLFVQSTPCLSDCERVNRSSEALLVRVRNGFMKLHRELAARFDRPEQKIDQVNYWDTMTAGGITEIFDGNWGKQFVISDYDGNLLIFYRPKKRLLGRSSGTQ
jgi:catechol 2,3-dioxygenase-like lactoylglutathione lyase family enzyme